MKTPNWKKPRAKLTARESHYWQTNPVQTRPNRRYPPNSGHWIEQPTHFGSLLLKLVPGLAENSSSDPMVTYSCGGSVAWGIPAQILGVPGSAMRNKSMTFDVAFWCWQTN
jgi:hypothetical protein